MSSPNASGSPLTRLTARGQPGLASGSGIRLGDKYVLGEELGRGAYGQVTPCLAGSTRFESALRS